MSYQVLARKWRPKKFGDVIGQGPIIRSLQNALQNNRMGHAYLLTGTRGIGKTTVARLMAAALRCENRDSEQNACGKCESCLDFYSGQSMNVIEIDGASNNGVDNIRDLISNVGYLPTTGSKKIYIIDEVHMLSTPAFNALLKTLEEPPEHVVFILATTEPQKLLGTVLSRCQRLDFRNATIKDLSDLIIKVSNAENIKFQDQDFITDIAELGKGSMRDTLSLLDQVLVYASDKVISEETLTHALGLAKKSSLKNITEGLFSGDYEVVAKELNVLKDLNIETENFSKALLNHLFKISENIDNGELLEKRGLCASSVATDISMPELIWIFETLAKDTSWVFNAPESDIVFQMVLKKIALRRSYFAKSEKVQKKSPEKPVEVAPTPRPKFEQPPVEEVKPVAPTPVLAPKVETPKIETPKVEHPKNWDGFMEFIREKSPTFASNLEQGNHIGEIGEKAGELYIQVGFKKTETIFYEYLKEASALAKLKGFVSQFFSKDEEKINLDLKMVDADEPHFKNRAEIEEDRLSLDREKKMEAIKNHPMIIKTEEAFNRKVQKIILNED